MEYLKRNTDWMLYSICFTIIIGNFIVEFAVGGEESAISDKIPVTNLNPLLAWMVNLYNNDRLLFAILVTVAMACVGIIIAMLTEVVLRLLGLKVSKIAHHE